MINSIDPNEFVCMLTPEFMEDCNRHAISSQHIARLCDCLNKLRAGIPVETNVTVRRLRTLNLINCRFTNLENNQTFLIKHLRHNLEDYSNDWKVELVEGINYISCNAGQITWTIAKGEGKILPKAYKEFLKCKFLGSHMPTINKLDGFYDRYIKTYNTHYQSELDKQTVV